VDIPLRERVVLECLTERFAMGGGAAFDCTQTTDKHEASTDRSTA
jgi:hypothetical protein